MATALSNLGSTREELVEAVGLFHEALTWRTVEREIARGVTLHNLGLARRRLAELEPARAVDHLEESAKALREAVAIRERHGLAEGARSPSGTSPSRSRVWPPNRDRFAA